MVFVRASKRVRSSSSPCTSRSVDSARATCAVRRRSAGVAAAPAALRSVQGDGRELRLAQRRRGRAPHAHLPADAPGTVTKRRRNRRCLFRLRERGVFASGKVLRGIRLAVTSSTQPRRVEDKTHRFLLFRLSLCAHRISCDKKPPRCRRGCASCSCLWP